MCHRQFFRVISQNRDYVDYFCNDRNNPFHFACQKWIKNCNNFKISILFLFQYNFIISRLLVYKTEYDVRRQGADTSTKTKN